MANVLGSQSYLDTPDVNGTLVLLVGDAVSTLNGTTNQISVSGTNPTRTVGLADNLIAPGTGSLTLPTGTTAQRPGTPTAGMSRFNSTTGVLEYYNGTSWISINGGTVIQTVTGTIPLASTNVIIPLDNTLPTSTEGAQLWSQSFTPLSATTTILIVTYGFYTVNNAADIYTIISTFNGTTCFGAAIAGWTTNTNDGTSFAIAASQTSGSTTARTYSARFGPNVNQAVYMNQQAGGGSLFGGTANVGRYIIYEIVT